MEKHSSGPKKHYWIFSFRLYLPRNELDNPHKSKTWKVYSEAFAVEMNFTEL